MAMENRIAIQQHLAALSGQVVTKLEPSTDQVGQWTGD